MISATESSASSSSSGPSRIASLKTSSSSRTGSMPSGSLPFDTTSSTMSRIFSRAVCSSPSRSTPSTVSRFMSRRLRSSRWICSCALRRISRIGSADSPGVSSSSPPPSAFGAAGAGSSTSGSGCGSSPLTRIRVVPIWTTIPSSSFTGPSTAAPFTKVPLALLRSSITADVPLIARIAWRSETSGNGSRMRQASARPTR